MRFAANASMIFSHLPFEDRPQAAVQAGFDAIEMYWPEPGELPASERDTFTRRLKSLGLEVVQLNFTAGDVIGVDCGVAGEPDRVKEFRANVPEALELADLLGCRRINALVGASRDGFSHSQQLETLAESIGFAADLAEESGVSIMLEGLNPKSHPGYLLPGNDAVLDFIESLGRTNVKLLFDLFHTLTNGDDPIAVINRAAGLIGNVQFAGFPGRHEPAEGGVAYGQILIELERVGYDDWVGLEYKPTSTDDAITGLAKVREFLVASEAAG